MRILGNILITGGAGFIGSHIAEKLLRMGNFVVVVDSLEYCSSKKNLDLLAQFKNFCFVEVMGIKLGKYNGCCTCKQHNSKVQYHNLHKRCSRNACGKFISKSSQIYKYQCYWYASIVKCMYKCPQFCPLLASQYG
jgi:tRNA A37 threonylcarbamoyladenosine dehydratase